MARRGAPRSSAAGRAPSSTRKSALRDCTGHGRRDCEREARGGGATGARRTAVVRVHEEDNRIHLRKVILPHAPASRGAQRRVKEREWVQAGGRRRGAAHRAISWPPKSKVRNLILAIESSSDAAARAEAGSVRGGRESA